MAAAALLGKQARTHGQTPRVSRWLLLGGSQGEGIYRLAWNPRTGEVGSPELAARTPQPTWLTLHPHLPVLYACNETDVATTSAVSAFRFDRAEGTLTVLGSQLTRGIAPCYVSVDRTGRRLFAANYGGGSLSTFALDGQGSLSPPALFECTRDLCGAGGPVPDRQTAPHLHCAVLSPDGHFLLACDLGDDAILAFPVGAHSATTLGTPSVTHTAPGDGPRHLAFHPNGRWFYCTNELSHSVSLYRFQTTGAGAHIERVADATVPLTPTATNGSAPSSGAELALTRDGRFLYASTRGADLLTLFSVDAKNGRLTQVQQLACGGRTPRFFALDATEQWLLCAHQDSNTVSVFARQPRDGQLLLHGTYPAPNPQCFTWL